MSQRLYRSALILLLPLLIGTSTVRGLEIEVVYDDPAEQGFNDPSLGAPRRTAFQAAVNQWASRLVGTVPVVLTATMPSFGGAGTSALLASTSAVTLHRNFGGARPRTWYAAALANQLARTDVNGPNQAEIDVRFNADVDGSEVLGSVGWYYGLDAQPGADIDFLTIALHEIGHGLGFLDTIDASTGTFRLDDEPSILERMLVRPEIGTLSDMLAPERLAAIVALQDLLWNGPAVVGFNGSLLPVYAPDPFQQGSSVAHWHTGLGELMEPFFTVANHDPGALLPALVDMGWELIGPTPTPRRPLATPTFTRLPRPSPTPATPRVRRDKIYVTNFDDATVSVVDAATRRVVRTVAVDEGPLGVAPSADGTRVYVAGFHAGTLSVLRTGDDRVIASIPVGVSPNAVAATTDGAFIAVTDTAADEVAIVAADRLEVVAHVFAGQQPSALALEGSGRLAFVTNFSGATVTVVDLDAQRRRAIIPVPFATPSDGLLGIAVARETGRGYIGSVYKQWARALRVDALSIAQESYPFSTDTRIEAVVTDAAGDLAYFVGHDSESGTGRLAVVDMEDNQALAAVVVGLVPEALALASDEALLYVANTGSNDLSVVDTALRRVVGRVPVGRAPMGVAVAAVPEGQCLDDCPTPTPTPIACAGDCDGDGRIAVNELVAAVAIALDREPMERCPAVDSNGDGRITVGELVGAVGRALDGC